MRKLPVYILLPFVLLLVAGLAHAQAPLTASQIDRWIDTVRDLEAWSDQIDEDILDAYEDEGEEGMPDLEAVYRNLARSEAEVQTIIRRHGFDDGDQWANIGSRIAQAFMALEMGDMQAEYEESIQETMREIEQSPHLTDEQKAMMMEQMRSAQGHLQAQIDQASEEDMRAVSQKRRELRRLFEFDEYED